MTDRRERIYTGRVITLDLADVRLPNGHDARLEVVGHPGGAAIVALDEADRVCLLRQYRYVANDWLWEVPAGKLEPGLSPKELAARELEEEAGRRARRWDPLGRYLASPGVFTEVVHLFLARDLEPCPPRPECEEVFESTWIPLESAAAQALSGEIVDGKSVVALLRAVDWLRRERTAAPGGV